MKIVGTAIIVNDRQEILIGQRPEGKDLAGLWEFPGGKCEKGETIEECIKREIKEELDVDVEVHEFLLEVKKEYQHGSFVLNVHKAKIKDVKNLKSNVHQKLVWVKVSELRNYEYPEADIDIIEYLERNF
ncbi:MAG: (deoxy)nucleoside triphosphate pyrophosphohydrolase [Alphaproteobacteria bacterium]|nr:(deoxy)nucleoside triphosphate pyrophosphohydrolase [Alphaproteobacteria bacterium]